MNIREIIAMARGHWTEEEWLRLDCREFPLNGGPVDYCGQKATVFVPCFGFVCDWHAYMVTHPNEIEAWAEINHQTWFMERNDP